MRGGGCASCLILRDAAMRAIHLLAPDSCKAGLGFNSSFSLGRKILGVMQRGKKNPVGIARVCAAGQGCSLRFLGAQRRLRGAATLRPSSHPILPPPSGTATSNSPRKCIPWKKRPKMQIIPIAPFVRKTPGPGLEPEKFFSPPEKSKCLAAQHFQPAGEHPGAH